MRTCSHLVRGRKKRPRVQRDGRTAPSVAVASLSSPHCSSGGFPESPAALNKGQSSARQRSKTCYFPALPWNPDWSSQRAGGDKRGVYAEWNRGLEVLHICFASDFKFSHNITEIWKKIFSSLFKVQYWEGVWFGYTAGIVGSTCSNIIVEQRTPPLLFTEEVSKPVSWGSTTKSGFVGVPLGGLVKVHLYAT